MSVYIGRPTGYSRFMAYVGFFIAGGFLLFNIHLTKEYISNQFGVGFGSDYQWMFSWLFALGICVYESVTTTPLFTPAAWPWLLQIPRKIHASEPEYRPFYLWGMVFSLFVIYGFSIVAFYIDFSASVTELSHVKSLVLRRFLAAVLVIWPEVLIIASANALTTTKITQLKSIPAEAELDSGVAAAKEFSNQSRNGRGRI